MRTAIFSPAYCLTHNQSRLTAMSVESIRLSARLMQDGADLLIVSCAYHVWEKERDLKLALLKSLGISSRVAVIENVTDSYDEARRTLKVLVDHNIEKIIIAGEVEHAPRSVRAFAHTIKSQGLAIEVVAETFKASKLERTYEPHRIPLLGWIKSVRVGNRVLWVLWNRAFYLVS